MSLFNVDWSLQVRLILPPVLRDRDFIEEDHDFDCGQVDTSYVEYILLSYPGHWKEFPPVGIAIWQYLNGNPSPQALSRAIRLQLENDVFIKPTIDVRDFPTIVINDVVTFTLQDAT